MLLCSAGITLDLFMFLLKLFHKVSSTNVDFPPPETPVTQVKIPKGNFTLIFFKLFPEAPFTTIFLLLFINLLFKGTLILSFPDKYLPVKLFSELIIFFKLPKA